MRRTKDRALNLIDEWQFISELGWHWCDDTVQQINLLPGVAVQESEKANVAEGAGSVASQSSQHTMKAEGVT